MNVTDIQEALALAQTLAAEAGAWLGRRREVGRVSLKADQSVVTEADCAIEDLIVSVLRRTYDDHAIVSEECAAASPAAAPGADWRTARYCWVVDPLDGSRNYAVGFPCFATSIALLDHGTPIIGVVREHNTGRVYAAAAGMGATADGRPVRVRTQTPDGDRLVGYPSSKDATTVRVAQAWMAAPRIVPRNVGSTAMHLALVAAGAIEAAYAYRCKIWDIAAGALLITEAGGVATGLDGGPLFPAALFAPPGDNVPILAGAPGLHAVLQCYFCY